MARDVNKSVSISIGPECSGDKLFVSGIAEYSSSHTATALLISSKRLAIVSRRRLSLSYARLGCICGASSEYVIINGWDEGAICDESNSS